MFIAERLYADAEIKEQSEIDAVVRSLVAKGYKPLLRSMLASACDVAKVSPNNVRIESLAAGRTMFRRSGSPPIVGELFFPAEESVPARAYVVQPVGSRLHAWEIRNHETTTTVAAFGSAVESSVRGALDGRRVRGMSFEWRPTKDRPLRHDAFPAIGTRLPKKTDLKTKPPEYTEEELKATRSLITPETRIFLIELAQIGKARSVDSGLGQEATESLLREQLVRKEYLVLCRQDSHVICKIGDRTELDDMRGGQFTCACGRRFKDELVQEILALTDFGKRLVNGSRWMTIWVTDLLVQAGIPRDLIRWNATAGEDELDIMTDALGPRVFFELKDRTFGLGDAYPFVIRVGRYGGTYGVVVTTDSVAEEAKKFLQEERPDRSTTMETIEGYKTIEGAVRSLVDRYSRIGVTEFLTDLADSIGINVVPVMSAWMNAASRAKPVAPCVALSVA